MILKKQSRSNYRSSSCLQTFEIDMEEEFLNIGLDIIGLGVFNYDFGSISKESPVIKVSFEIIRTASRNRTGN